MHADQVQEILGASGFVLDEEKTIQYGVQLKFTNGSLASIFDKGTVTPQGKDVGIVKQLLGLAPGRQAALPQQRRRRLQATTKSSLSTGMRSKRVRAWTQCFGAGV